MSCHKLSGSFTKNIKVTTNDPANSSVNLTCKGTILEAIKTDPARVYFGRVSRTSPPVTKTVTIKRGDGGPLKLKLKPNDKKGVEATLREIDAGEHYELDITLSTPLKSNRLTMKLEVETGITEAPTAYVPVFAVVTPRLTTNPRRVVVPPGRAEDWEQKVRLRWDDGAPPEILSVSIDTPQITAQYLESGRPSQVQTIVVKASGREEIPPGLYTLLIKTDDAVVPETKVPVTVRIPVPKRRAGAGRPAPVSQGKAKRRIRTTGPAVPPTSGAGKAKPAKP